MAASPETVQRFCSRGLQVWIEADAGAAAGFTDQAYSEAGATILASGHGAWAEFDLPHEHDIHMPVLAARATMPRTVAPSAAAALPH